MIDVQLRIAVGIGRLIQRHADRGLVYRRRTVVHELHHDAQILVRIGVAQDRQDALGIRLRITTAEGLDRLGIGKVVDQMKAVVGAVYGEDFDVGAAGAVHQIATNRIEAIGGNIHVEKGVSRAAAGVKIAGNRAENVATTDAKLEQKAIITVDGKPIKTSLQL